MKYFLLLFLLNPFFTQAAEVIFHGKLKNSKAESVDIILQGNDLLKEDIIYRAKINDQNEFSLVLNIDHPQIIKIKGGEKTLHLFAMPTEPKIEFEFDINAPSASLVLKGKNVFDNSFYNSFMRTFQWDKERSDAYEMGGLKTQVTPDVKRMAMSYSNFDYFRIIENLRTNQLQYLHTSKSLSIGFYRYLENEINWRYETNKVAYFLFNKDRFTVGELKGQWIKHSLMQSAKLNESKNIEHPTFQNLLNGFIHFLHLQTPVETKIEQSYYTFISNNLQDKSRYFMLAKLMANNYRIAGNPTLALEKLKAFKRENPYEEYNKSLNQIFGENLEYLTSKNAPNMKVLDLSEQEIWLMDYSGKVVYVSFWASWCAPCLKGFRESKSFREEMEKQGVVFLNINLDDREDIWRSALSRNNIIGKNVYALDMKEAKEELKISALPYYFLMNKSGKISYLSSSKLEECKEDFIQFLVE